MSWTQPICIECWNRREPERLPTRIVEEEKEWERCAFCGWLTRSGIYTRVDPTSVAFPRSEL